MGCALSHVGTALSKHAWTGHVPAVDDPNASPSFWRPQAEVAQRHSEPTPPSTSTPEQIAHQRATQRLIVIGSWVGRVVWMLPCG